MTYSKLKLIGKQDADLEAGLGMESFTESHSVETFRVDFNEKVDFGKKLNLNLPKRADLFNEFRLIVKLPALVVNTGTFASWTNNIGHALIKCIDLEIGGKSIKKLYSEFLDISEELYNDNKDNYLIGKYLNVENVKANGLVDNEYVITFKFFDVPFPLASVPFEQVRLLFELRDFSDCVVYDGIEPIRPKIDCYLMVDYLYLNDLAAAKLRSNQEKSIFFTEIQRTSLLVSGTFRMDLDFNGPVKSLILVLRERASVENNDHFNYTLRNGVPFTKTRSLLKSITFKVNGVDYISNVSEINHRLNDRYMYEIPFCEHPRKPEYSGSLNFSRIDNAELNGEMENVDAELIVFAASYNWLVTEDGHSYIKYMN